MKNQSISTPIMLSEKFLKDTQLNKLVDETGVQTNEDYLFISKILNEKQFHFQEKVQIEKQYQVMKMDYDRLKRNNEMVKQQYEELQAVFYRLQRTPKFGAFRKYANQQQQNSPKDQSSYKLFKTSNAFIQDSQGRLFAQDQADQQIEKSENTSFSNFDAQNQHHQDYKLESEREKSDISNIQDYSYQKTSQILMESPNQSLIMKTKNQKLEVSQKQENDVFQSSAFQSVDVTDAETNLPHRSKFSSVYTNQSNYLSETLSHIAKYQTQEISTFTPKQYIGMKLNVVNFPYSEASTNITQNARRAAQVDKQTQISKK